MNGEGISRRVNRRMSSLPEFPILIPFCAMARLERFLDWYLLPPSVPSPMRMEAPLVREDEED